MWLHDFVFRTKLCYDIVNALHPSRPRASSFSRCLSCFRTLLPDIVIFRLVENIKISRLSQKLSNISVFHDLTSEDLVDLVNTTDPREETFRWSYCIHPFTSRYRYEVSCHHDVPPIWQAPYIHQQQPSLPCAKAPNESPQDKIQKRRIRRRRRSR